MDRVLYVLSSRLSKKNLSPHQSPNCSVSGIPASLVALRVQNNTVSSVIVDNLPAQISRAVYLTLTHPGTHGTQGTCSASRRFLFCMRSRRDSPNQAAHSHVNSLDRVTQAHGGCTGRNPESEVWRSGISTNPTRSLAGFPTCCSWFPRKGRFQFCARDYRPQVVRAWPESNL
jgi:hypothetical protein